MTVSANKGTQLKEGLIDGIAHVEAASATLVNGVTTVTLGLDKVVSAVASNLATNKLSPQVTKSGKQVTVRTAGGDTHKVYIVAVGPRTTKYTRAERDNLT